MPRDGWVAASFTKIVEMKLDFLIERRHVLQYRMTTLLPYNKSSSYHIHRSTRTTRYCHDCHTTYCDGLFFTLKIVSRLII